MSEDISPLIVLNLKTSEKATGYEAVQLALQLQEAAEDKNVALTVAAQATDIYRIKEEVPQLTVYAQNIDLEGYGANTGSITAEAINDADADGTLLNHSEWKKKNKIQYDVMKKIIDREANPEDELIDCAQSDMEKNIIEYYTNLKNTIKRAQDLGLEVITCAESAEEAEYIASFGPNYIAVEPPELIGGDVSVTTRPELISESIEKVSSVNDAIKVLVGAGVKTYDDVKIAMELGAYGVLLASGITKAEKPVDAFKGLIGK